MQHIPLRLPDVLLAAALLAPAAALAQTQARVGNTWDWRDHQPTQAQVEQQEKAVGVVPSPSERAATTATLRQLGQQLLDESHH